ncbi:MAG: phosphate ABC transporter permease PstA [Actinomycetota bacterium]|nr:phosphate ABC transporter permease PstA [Actinomycetota bacterium]
MSTPRRSAAQAVGDLRGGERSAARERGFSAVLLAATVLGVVVLAVLLLDVILDGLGRLDLRFLTSYASRYPEDTGVRAGVTGTLSLMLLVAAMSFPLGVGAAVYLEEFAPDNRFTRLMEANISNLAGVPSVVYGLLGAAVFVYLVEFGRSLITGALTLTLLILPVIIVASRESIRAVPGSIRDGGLALGATPWQVVSRQVLPAALPGIFTGTILALSRAIGETAPLIVVGAAASLRTDSAPWELGEAFTALPIQIYGFVTYPDEAFQVDAASAGIIVLMVLLLLMNSAAILLRNRYQRKS